MATEPASDFDHRPDLAHDTDPEETREWIESLASTLEREGVERAHFLLDKLVDHARRSGAHLPFDATTAYEHHPGDAADARARRPWS